MLLSLSELLLAMYPQELGFLRVFQYLTFRAVLAAMTALLQAGVRAGSAKGRLGVEAGQGRRNRGRGECRGRVPAVVCC